MGVTELQPLGNPALTAQCTEVPFRAGGEALGGKDGQGFNLASFPAPEESPCRSQHPPSQYPRNEEQTTDTEGYREQTLVFVIHSAHPACSKNSEGPPPFLCTAKVPSRPRRNSQNEDGG